MKYETRVVAFIDILGFKESVDRSTKSKKEFDRILKTLTELKEFFLRPKSEYSLKEENEFGFDTQITQVSDSLIISRVIHEKGGIYSMLSDCSFAIHLLIENEFLCRGAVKVGKMYHHGSILFGEAYLKAYAAEANERLPIVKFDELLFDIVKLSPVGTNKGFEEWEVNFIKKNCKQLITGIYYVDYFTDYDDRVGGGDGSAYIHYSKLREIILNGLKIPKEQNAYEKYRWAADQFNHTAQMFGLECIR